MDPYSVYMDLDEAVSTPTKPGEPDMTTVAQCADLLSVDPSKLLSFVLGSDVTDRLARAWDQGFVSGCMYQAGNKVAWDNPNTGAVAS